MLSVLDVCTVLGPSGVAILEHSAAKVAIAAFKENRSYHITVRWGHEDQIRQLVTRQFREVRIDDPEDTVIPEDTYVKKFGDWKTNGKGRQWPDNANRTSKQIIASRHRVHTHGSISETRVDLFTNDFHFSPAVSFGRDEHAALNFMKLVRETAFAIIVSRRRFHWCFRPARCVSGLL
jgi:hypothetical protein